MSKTKKILFVLSLCMLTMLAVFSVGFSLGGKKKVEARTGGVQDIVVTAFYEELNSGEGGIFTEGTTGGMLGKTTNCQERNITIDTNSQTVFYAKANNGFYLEGVYSTFDNNEFSGESLDIDQNDDYYSITYSGQVSSKFYAKFTRKRITITLENGADFTLSGNGTYVYGTTVQLNCIENTKNYKFSRWVKVIGEELTDFSRTSSYKFEAQENIRLRAVPKLLIETKDSLNGQIQVSLNNTLVSERYFEKGTVLKIRAVANLGYKFVNYDLGDFLNNPQEFDFTVESPLSFGAIFESKKITVNIATDNLEESNLDGSTNIKDSQFVIGDKITVNVNITKLFGLIEWQTNASGTFDKNSVSQTYTLTAQDAERGNVSFLAKIRKVLASCEFQVSGKGMLFINDTYTRTTLIEDKDLSSEYLITVIEGTDYYISDIIYTNTKTGEEQNWFDKLNDKNFSFTVEEDFKLVFKFSPLTWSQIKKEPKGLGTKHSPYIISCAEELAYMEYGINHDVKAKTDDAVDYRKAYFKLTNNIDLNGRYWILIGANGNAKFDGVLDLNYKFITNITLVDDSYSSNLKYLFTSENSQHAKIIHDADVMWRTVGISSSVFFGLALVFVLVAFLTNNRVQVKKVVVLNDENKQNSSSNNSTKKAQKK